MRGSVFGFFCFLVYLVSPSGGAHATGKAARARHR
jgi:hypothetical protein